MNKKITTGILLTGIMLFLVVLVLVNLYLFSLASCTSVERIGGSLTVKIVPGRTMLGLNADTDSLAWGVVSPGITAQRKVTVRRSRDAQVKVWMEGELSSWASVSPSNFTLFAGESKEVSFDVTVPAYALPGNYTATAVFCIKE